MDVFYHHIYEYKKGLRQLILHTTAATNRIAVEARLKKHGIPYIIDDVSSTKINIFFGAEECINVLRLFGNTRLSDYTDEQDFILGVMLGYDRTQQCQRYIDRKKKKQMKESA